MKRFYQLLPLLIVVTGAFIAVRYSRHQHARSLALAVVDELGGRVGSITAPFGGTEYCISFPGRTLTRVDIDRLVILRPLAKLSYVSLSLNDATISREDHEYLLQKLSEVHVMPLEHGPVQ
jgi:hypothetical protein